LDAPATTCASPGLVSATLAGSYFEWSIRMRAAPPASPSTSRSVLSPWNIESRTSTVAVLPALKPPADAPTPAAVGSLVPTMVMCRATIDGLPPEFVSAMRPAPLVPPDSRISESETSTEPAPLTVTPIVERLDERNRRTTTGGPGSRARTIASPAADTSSISVLSSALIA
jgi:hypothetical protein